MNARLDYKVKALTLRLLLVILGSMVNIKGRKPLEALQAEAEETIAECEAVSDGRQSL